MKEKLVLILLLSVVFAARLQAQGIEPPSPTSFKPDTSLPKVNVPEFVITGKAQIALPQADKPSVEIDSSYFQGKKIKGIGVNLPANRSLSSQERASGGEAPQLFARASIGHYATMHYLISGSDGIDGYLINGSLSGGYTSGFMPYTIQRNFFIQGGVSKDFNLDQTVTLNNALTLGYARSSYFLYGQSQPSSLRKTERFTFGVNSDANFGELPLEFGLGFDRFSAEDYWDGVQSLFKVEAGTHFSLPSGDLRLDGTFHFGNHTRYPKYVYPIGFTPVPPVLISRIDRSLYDLSAGVTYSNGSDVVRYSLGLNYYQYEDDSSSGVAKLYPDLRANYRLNGNVLLFARYYGTVEESDLSDLMTTDRYVDGALELKNTQRYADFVMGSRIRVSNELALTPQFNIQASRYYPIFVSDAANNSAVSYASKTTIVSVLVTADYTKDNFSTDATLRFQKGSADSLTSIPNLPPLDLNLGATYRITPQFRAGIQLLFLSSRHSDRALVNMLDAVGLLNLRLSYGSKIVNVPFEVFLDGHNLLNQKYFVWQGYQEFPMILSVGLSSKIL